MYTVSSSWDLAIRSGTRRKAVVDLYVDPSSGGPATLSNLEVSDWSITDDRRSEVRRTGTVKIISSDLKDELAQNPNSILHPFGAEIHLRVGFVYPIGEELIPMGVFIIESTSFNEETDEIVFELSDRMKVLQLSSFSSPTDFSGMAASTFFEGIITETMPWVTFSYEHDRDFILPGGTAYSGSRLDAIWAVQHAVGVQVFFDRLGAAKATTLVSAERGTTPSQAQWKIDVGSTGVMISANTSITRRDTHNRVNVTGTAIDSNTPPPYGFDLDGNPSSPTYYYGGFGKVDLNVTRQEITTDDQASYIAKGLLRNAIGLQKIITFKSLQNAALDSDDIVHLVFPDGREEVHLADSISHDASGSFDIETRYGMV